MNNVESAKNSKIHLH